MTSSTGRTATASTPSAAGGSPAAAGPMHVVQMLTPDGRRVDHEEDPALAAHAATLTAEDLRGMYRDMALARRVDVEATALQRQGELGLWASLLGQEAAQVGSARATLPQDRLFPTYREHAVAMVRGVDPAQVLSLFRGVDRGGWDVEATGLSPYALVIGSQTLHATGYAMGVQRDGAVGTGDPARDACVLAYFGDGASSQGDVNEAFVFATAYQAPVVFVCQNNQWAISVPAERQTRVPIAQRASGFGFPGVRVDGNDVVACYAVVRAAAERARAGEGPTLVEAFTYRMGAHTTSDDPGRYRPSVEVEQWRARDPLTRLEAHLRRDHGADDAFFADVAREGDTAASRLRRAVLEMPDPEPGSMFDHAYAAEHPQVEEERAWYAAYLAGLDGEEGRTA
ncbi:pyruvate dehydrogenase (acetyl-transferring) E1 component subunit alpha [uncultured Pseudokineococcus sp.]|uniref:pyruvate dehydrogenase (acetyl-transferring) E1 component subunit alpha n=1 Tax=uncultured Pseudokineococcus sp. TaxID=1642928 RepID=UPI002627A1F8|nr:pyruvate dehydrogenase (acetyl-transferring) E1 component subunit alpha [uncultured Pseudokineococcus sp.]